MGLRIAVIIDAPHADASAARTGARLADALVGEGHEPTVLVADATLAGALRDLRPTVALLATGPAAARAHAPQSLLEYLRIPAEPTAPFLKPAILASIRPINWAKHLVLNWCWGRDRRLLADYEEVSALFCGVLFSGSMSEGRVRAVFPAYARLAEERGMGIEFLFHPGGLDDPSRCLDPTLKGFPEFYLSGGRDVERRALMALGPGGSALLDGDAR